MFYVDDPSVTPRKSLLLRLQLLLLLHCIFLTEFAVEGISDGLRLELHEFGIAVTTLEPGIVSSPLVAKMHASVPNLNGTVDEVRSAFFSGEGGGVKLLVFDYGDNSNSMYE